jgi:hypothetical protein
MVFSPGKIKGIKDKEFEYNLWIFEYRKKNQRINL